MQTKTQYNHDFLKLLAGFTLIISLFFPFLAHAYTGVTIVLSEDTPESQEFVTQFEKELANYKYVNLRVNVTFLSGTKRLVIAENSELVIALGVKALNAASKLKHTTPVLAVFTPLTSYNRLLVKSRRHWSNFSVIQLEQPFSRQISLIKLILPNAQKLGALIGPTSSKYAGFLKEESAESGLGVLEKNVNQEADLIPNLIKLLESTDALVAIPDSSIYNHKTAQSIFLTSYRYQRPIFGYSQSNVAAGALATAYTTTKQLAKQAAEIAIESQQAPCYLPPPQGPKYFKIMFNHQVARSLNIDILDEEVIYQKLLKADALEVAENEKSRH